MYVAIDMDRHAVLYKHHDHETVSAISWLECGQHTSIRIDNVEGENFLKGVAHGDLCYLYKNVTGDEFHEAQWGARSYQFRERLREAMRNMTATIALSEEVFAQVDAVDDRLHNGERFKYALGARVPAQPGELFPLTFVPLTPTQITAADGRASDLERRLQEFREAEKRGDFLPAASRDPMAKPWETEEDAPAPAAAEQEPKLAKARTGSVQPVVFAAAKEAWEKRQPDATWKQIREELFDRLTAEGFHPTTVRIKLSKWAKENAIPA